MNRIGVLCDLSHGGPVTSRDVILASNRPVAYTHILPAALKAHSRNKSDEEIRFIADRGGFVGVTMFPPFLGRGNDSAVEDCVAAIGYVTRIAGEDNVGIGTDFTQDQDGAFFEYLCLDKGYGWRVTGPLGEIVNPAGMRTIADFPNLTAAMERAGWPEAKIRKVMGENWLRLLAEVRVEKARESPDGNEAMTALMRPNPVRDTLRAGGNAYGTIAFEFFSPGLVAILAGAGADFVLLAPSTAELVSKRSRCRSHHALYHPGAKRKSFRLEWSRENRAGSAMTAPN